VKSKPESPNSDPKEGAIKRLKNEVNKLLRDQLEALKTETYLGATSQDKKNDDTRRQRISDLNTEVDRLRQAQHGYDRLSPRDRNRLEKLAARIRDEQDDAKFEGLVSELNDLLSKSKYRVH